MSNAFKLYGTIRPIVQGRRIKAGSIGPNQHLNFGGYFDLVEKLFILQGAVHITRQHTMRIDRLYSVRELDTQMVLTKRKIVL